MVFEDEEGEDVDNNAKELGKEHEAMPGAEGKSHHQKLREDECRERDGNHMNELGLKQQEPQ